MPPSWSPLPAHKPPTSDQRRYSLRYLTEPSSALPLGFVPQASDPKLERGSLSLFRLTTALKILSISLSTVLTTLLERIGIQRGSLQIRPQDPRAITVRFQDLVIQSASSPPVGIFPTNDPARNFKIYRPHRGCDVKGRSDRKISRRPALHDFADCRDPRRKYLWLERTGRANVGPTRASGEACPALRPRRKRARFVKFPPAGSCTCCASEPDRRPPRGQAHRSASEVSTRCSFETARLPCE